MRIQTAKNSEPEIGCVLVLGERTFRHRIEEEFRAEGFEIFPFETIEAEFPHVASPSATDQLREVLKRNIPMIRWIHPGVSHWAERPDLSQIGRELGIEVIAPSPKILSIFGNRLTLLAQGEKLGLPHLIQSFEPFSTVRELDQLILEGLDFPFVVKSVQLPGLQTGIFVVHDASDLKERLPLWIEQVRRFSGEDVFLVESYLDGAIHITQSFARFKNGTIEFFPAIDSSLQSRNRKVLEICPASRVDFILAAEVQKLSRQLLEEVQYVGTGSLEFMLEGERAFLVGGQTRLNVSFPLWESVTQTKVVAWQLATMGLREPPAVKKSTDVALSVRIYAENSTYQIPCPGILAEVPEKSAWKDSKVHAEWISPWRPGDLVSYDTEGLLGILVVQAQERKRLFEFARDILGQIWFSGSLQTNALFLRELLEHPWVKEEMVHASFVEEEFIPNLFPDRDLCELFAGLCRDVADQACDRWWVNERSVYPSEIKFDWMIQPLLKGSKSKVASFWTGALRWKGEVLRFCIFPMGDTRWQVRLGFWSLLVRCGRSKRKNEKSKSGSLPVNALAEGRIHSILYRKGSRVPANSTLLVIESLHTLVAHSLPIEVKLTDILVRPEDIVKLGQELARVVRFDKTSS